MCPRTKEQNDRIRERRRREIVQAAADVWLDKGHALEIRDVALRAGLGYGTVYHYYPNKYRLLDDMLGEAVETSAAAVGQLPAEDGPHGTALVRFAETLLRLWATDRSTFILYKAAAENYRSVPADTRRLLDERFQSRLFAPLAETVRREAGCGAAEAERLAGILLASLVGCAGLHLFRGQFDIHTQAMAGMLVNGLLAGKERETQ